MITTEFKKEVLKILQTQYKFGQNKAKELFESNLFYIDINSNCTPEEMASSLEEIYINEQDEDND